MFDSLQNLGNIGSLMSRAREMQDKMKSLQEELARKQFSADAGDGLVTAIVNGGLQLVNVRIDQSRVDLNQIGALEQLIVAAVAGAQVKAAETMKAEMAKLASDMGLPPGMLPG